jgi:uncharacterized oxidoreductase
LDWVSLKEAGMKLSGNTVLITGGGTGIGLALARSFLEAGSEVVACGRRQSKLAEAKEKLPELHTIACDVSLDEGRKYLLERVTSSYKGINILINNAGVQRMVDFTRGPGSLMAGESEIDVNLKAPIFLSASLVPLLSKHKEAAIVNVSSGLAFAPLAFMPIYCATKAAVHSFTVSLRYQLKGTSIKVFELIPPRVDTDLGYGERGDRGRTADAIPAGQVAAETMAAMGKDIYEIAVGAAKDLLAGSRKDPDALFRSMNAY